MWLSFVSGAKKTSYPLSKALAGWKQGFLDTKSGKMKANVEFKFTQRWGYETTAHETGIFHYWTVDANGTRKDDYANFEAAPGEAERLADADGVSESPRF
jgi:hypothetical protein